MLFCELQVPLLVAAVARCDNVSTLALTSNPVFHAHTKHIEVDYHFVRKKVFNRDLLISSISTTDQVADVFTNGLSTARFLFLKSKLKVIPSPINLRGDVKSSDMAADMAVALNATEATMHGLHPMISKAVTTAPMCNIAAMPTVVKDCMPTILNTKDHPPISIN